MHERFLICIGCLAYHYFNRQQMYCSGPEFSRKLLTQVEYYFREKRTHGSGQNYNNEASDQMQATCMTSGHAPRWSAHAREGMSRSSMTHWYIIVCYKRPATSTQIVLKSIGEILNCLKQTILLFKLCN